jgi:hypothetical protein
MRTEGLSRTESDQPMLRWSAAVRPRCVTLTCRPARQSSTSTSSTTTNIFTPHPVDLPQVTFRHTHSLSRHSLLCPTSPTPVQYALNISTPSAPRASHHYRDHPLARALPTTFISIFCQNYAKPQTRPDNHNIPTMRLRKAARMILIGAPGAGKGTQSTRMLERYEQLSTISSGDLLRENVRNRTPLGALPSLSTIS